MRTPSRAAPTSRHFPISEYRQLRGLQERLVRIDEPSRPMPVKANLIMHEQDHARTFSERSNHAAEEKKTLPAPCQNRSLGALPFARREHVARHRVCRRRPSGKRRTGERPARSSAKRALPPWQGRHSRKLIRIRQPNQPRGHQPRHGTRCTCSRPACLASTTGRRPAMHASADGSRTTKQGVGEGVASEAGRNPRKEADRDRPKGMRDRDRPNPFSKRAPSSATAGGQSATRSLSPNYPNYEEVRRDVLPPA